MERFAILVCLLGLAQSARIEWTHEVYPDPRTDQESCGRPADRETYICDPNGILSTKDADLLDAILEKIPTNTSCPCSAWSCERENSKYNTGYIMVVVLMKKLEIPEDVPKTGEAKKNVARKFAFNLLRKNWKDWGNCDEVTVILWSEEDGVLVTFPGTTSERVLTYEATNAIQHELVRFFRHRDNIGQGLHYLTMNYKRVLDGEHYLPVMYSDVASGAAILKLSVLTSLVTTLLLKIFC